MKVRISYFSKHKVYDPADYPEQIVDMSEEEFEEVVEDACYYDERQDMWYSINNRDAIGYEIIG